MTTKTKSTKTKRAEAMLFPPKGNIDKETVLHWTPETLIIGTNHPTILRKLTKLTKPDKVMEDGFSNFVFDFNEFDFEIIPKKKRVSRKVNKTVK